VLVASGGTATRSGALSATGRIYQCAIASELCSKSGRPVAKRGINTVDSPRTAQATARSGRCRGSKRERERERKDT